MLTLVASIYDCHVGTKAVDGRDKRGHDGGGSSGAPDAVAGKTRS